MAVRHMTDNDFQAYLERDNTAEYTPFDTHLNDCKKCRHELKQYRLLYDGLKQDIGYNLNPGFSDALMTRLIINQEVQQRNHFDKFMYLTGMLVALLVGGYFLDLNKIASAMAGPFVPVFDTLKNLSSSYIELIPVSNQSFGILCFSALILIGVYFADNLLLNYKEKRFCL
jgi:hypothetical protein